VSDIGQARLGDATDSVASNGVAGGAAESDTRDHYGASAGLKGADVNLFPSEAAVMRRDAERVVRSFGPGENGNADLVQFTVNPFNVAVGTVFRDAEALLHQKHADYGPKNISQSPGGPLNGLRVRMWDKLARINHLIDSGVTPENESLRDSFVDLMNYAAIAQLVLDGDWPQG
jgi:hypothetical protein